MKVLHIGKDQVRLAVRAADTDGRYCVMIFAYSGPTDEGPPRHTHEDHDESFLVIEGEFDLIEGTETHRLHAGDAVSIKRGTPHVFRPVGQGPAQMGIIASPGDFEGFFLALDEVDQTASDAKEQEQAIWEKWKTYPV